MLNFCCHGNCTKSQEISYVVILDLLISAESIGLKVKGSESGHSEKLATILIEGKHERLLRCFM